MNPFTATITTAADLVAAIPALLGYTPTDAVILATYRTPDHRTYTDVTVTVVRGHADTRTAIDTAAARPTAHPAAWLYAAVIAVHPRRATTLARRRATATYSELWEYARRDDAPRFRPDHIIATRAIAAGEPFTNYARADKNGTLPDPATSPVALHLLTEGYPAPAATRDALAARYQRAPHRMSAIQLEHAARMRRADEGAAHDAEAIHAAAVAIARNEPPTRAVAAAIGVTIAADLHARDAVLTLALRRPAAGIAILTDVARHTTDSARVATLATLAAVTYTSRVAGPAALILEAIAAEHVDPPNLARLLRGTIATGKPSPAEIRDMFDAPGSLTRFGIE